MLPAVAIIFFESKHFLRDDIANTDSFFCKLITAIEAENSERAKKIILNLYSNNFQNKKSKAPIPHHVIDPAVLWLINTTECCRYLALVCFISNFFFQRATHIVCCDYCMYYKWNENDTDIPAFEHQGVTVQHCWRYLQTIEYQKAQSWINAAKRTKRSRTDKEN